MSFCGPSRGRPFRSRSEDPLSPNTASGSRSVQGRRSGTNSRRWTHSLGQGAAKYNAERGSTAVTNYGCDAKLKPCSCVACRPCKDTRKAERDATTHDNQFCKAGCRERWHQKCFYNQAPRAYLRGCGNGHSPMNGKAALHGLVLVSNCVSSRQHKVRTRTSLCVTSRTATFTGSARSDWSRPPIRRLGRHSSTLICVRDEVRRRK